MTQQAPGFRTAIWEEAAEADNPFEARACYCQGYDVYGDLLGKAGWIEYLYLLFRGERPTPAQAALLERLAVALANRGPRDSSVRAAMNGGVGGSTAAGTLMAALAIGAGQHGGAREVYRVVELWRQCGPDTAAWQAGLAAAMAHGPEDIWPRPEHPPGFEPNGVSCPTPVRQTLAALAATGAGPATAWLHTHREALEAVAGCPLAMSGVAGAALFDLGLSPEAAEMLFLLLRLPGAAVHALEQQALGWKAFPYIGPHIELEDDPGSRGVPQIPGINA